MRYLSFLVALAWSLLPTAAAQPFAVVETVGPVQVSLPGLDEAPLEPLAALADAEGFVVLAMTPRDAEPRDAARRLVALRLDADGAVTAQHAFPPSRYGRVGIVIEPRVTDTLHPDGDGALFAAVFQEAGGASVLRAVRLGADLVPRSVAEWRVPPNVTLDAYDVTRLTERTVLFSGRVLINGGRNTRPLAVVVSDDGSTGALATPGDWDEEVSSAVTYGSGVALAGWMQRDGEHTLLVRTYDAELQPAAAQRVPAAGLPRRPRAFPFGDGQILLASTARDSTDAYRLLVALVAVPDASLRAYGFAGDPMPSAYSLVTAQSVADVGVVLLGRRSRGGPLRYPVLVGLADGDRPGWTLSVGTPAGATRPLALGAGGGLLLARRDDGDVWHIEVGRLSAERPASTLLADPRAAPDADAFDAYARRVLATTIATERGAALLAYGEALDAVVDSAAASGELQRQASALLDADFARGTDAVIGGGPRLQLRVRPGLSVERQRCIGAVFLWTFEAERAAGNAAAVAVPERPVTDCDG